MCTEIAGEPSFAERRSAPRIHGELLKLGIDIGETSVGRYIVRTPKPPSQTWRTFLENHVKTLVSIDFFTVPTIRFQVLYVFMVLAHDRRRILHFNVTAHPTAEWTVQQLRETFPFEQLPRFLAGVDPSFDRPMILFHYVCSSKDRCDSDSAGLAFPPPLVPQPPWDTTQPQRAMLPENIRDLDESEMIVVPGGFQGGRKPYYQTDEFKGRWDPDPYHIG